MAWSYVVTGKTVWGNKRVSFGTWNGAGVTGGDILTGLKRIESFLLGHTGSAAEAAAAVANETFPLAKGDVTVVCTSGDTGTWLAVGR